MEIKFMRIIVDVRLQFLLNELAAAFGLLLVGCPLIAGSHEKATPVVIPYEGAPLTAAVDGEMLVIVNNSENTLYHRIFPTDILPAIEWAPSIAPERCPAEQRIDFGHEKRIAPQGNHQRAIGVQNCILVDLPGVGAGCECSSTGYG